MANQSTVDFLAHAQELSQRTVRLEGAEFNNHWVTTPTSEQVVVPQELQDCQTAEEMDELIFKWMSAGEVVNQHMEVWDGIELMFRSISNPLGWKLGIAVNVRNLNAAQIAFVLQAIHFNHANGALVKHSVVSDGYAA